MKLPLRFVEVQDAERRQGVHGRGVGVLGGGEERPLFLDLGEGFGIGEAEGIAEGLGEPPPVHEGIGLLPELRDESQRCPGRLAGPFHHGDRLRPGEDFIDAEGPLVASLDDGHGQDGIVEVADVVGRSVGWFYWGDQAVGTGYLHGVVAGVVRGDVQVPTEGQGDTGLQQGALDPNGGQVAEPDALADGEGRKGSRGLAGHHADRLEAQGPGGEARHGEVLLGRKEPVDVSGDESAQGDLERPAGAVDLDRGRLLVELPLHIRIGVRAVQVQDITSDRDGVGELVAGLSVAVAQGVFQQLRGGQGVVPDDAPRFPNVGDGRHPPDDLQPFVREPLGCPGQDGMAVLVVGDRPVLPQLVLHVIDVVKGLDQGVPLHLPAKVQVLEVARGQSAFPLPAVLSRIVIAPVDAALRYMGPVLAVRVVPPVVGGVGKAAVGVVADDVDGELHGVDALEVHAVPRNVALVVAPRQLVPGQGRERAQVVRNTPGVFLDDGDPRDVLDHGVGIDEGRDGVTGAVLGMGQGQDVAVLRRVDENAAGDFPYASGVPHRHSPDRIPLP